MMDKTLIPFIDDILAEARDIDPGFQPAMHANLRTPEGRILKQRHDIAYGLRMAAQMLGWDPDDPPWCDRPRS
jgi:hypothetical protein